MNSITVPLAVGTMAAILTAAEYILSTASALCIRAAMHGFWLVGLHRGGTASLDTGERLKRTFTKDIAGALLGIWLVFGVALVESNLKEAFQIVNKEVNSTDCVSMFGKYKPTRIKLDTPPYRTILEPWVLQVAKKNQCGEDGIASVGVGGATDVYGNKKNMSAPVCVDKHLRVDSQLIQATLTVIKVQKFFFTPHVPDSESYVLFPHSCEGIGKRIDHLANSEGKGPCGRQGISSFFNCASPTLQTTHVHYLNASKALHDEKCIQHGEKSLRGVPNDTVRECIQARSINGKCLLARAPKELIHTFRSSRASALFLGQDIGSQAYACPNAIVEEKYVFIDPSFISQLGNSATPKLKLLVVLSARVAKGGCEPTVNVLGQAALMYTADAGWRRDELSKYDKRTLYHAYMMAVSSSQFPLNHVEGKESATINGSCYIKPVTGVTEIAWDWRLFLLVSGLVCSILIIAAGAVFRLIYTGESWEVGSAHWSLSHLLAGMPRDKDDVPCLEVVAVPPANTSSPNSRRSSDASAEANTLGTVSFPSFVASPRRSGEGHYKYIVRSPNTATEDRENDEDTK